MKDNMLAFTLLCSLCVWTVDAKALLIQNTAEDHFKRPEYTPNPMMTPVQDTTEPPLKGPHVSTPVYMMTAVQDTTEAPLNSYTPVYRMTPVQDTTEPPLKGPRISTPVYMTTPVQDTTEPTFKGPHVSTRDYKMIAVQDTTEPPLKVPHASTPVYMMTPAQDHTEPPLKGPSISTPVMTPVQDTTESPLKGPHVSTPVSHHMMTSLHDTTAVPEVHFKPQNVSIHVPVKTPDISMQVYSSYKLSSISLDMASHSVDDMYHGCSGKMLIQVKRNFLRESSKKEALFTKMTERCATQALKVKDSYDSLSWDHFKALCAYTASAFTDLNGAVRKGKATYKTTFEFHALHFLLTDAIQRLKQNQRNCYTSYRRSKQDFIGEVGQTMRFGSFASSSLSTELAHFGSKTCFEILTCFGAFLKSYTEFGADEQEVLIPPYEMFTIVSVDRSGKNDLRCDVLYKLQTSGIHSSLNCQLARLR